MIKKIFKYQKIDCFGRRWLDSRFNPGTLSNSYREEFEEVIYCNEVPVKAKQAKISWSENKTHYIATLTYKNN